MTNTIIQKKTPLSYLILTTLGILALLMVFSSCSTNKNTKGMGSTDLINLRENNSIVATYVNFVENNKETMSLDHEYTNEALLKLIEATNAMANEVGYDVRADIGKVREYAKMIVKDPFETTHADNIRKADDILTNVLQNIQRAKYPGLADEVAALKSASESIKPEVLTLDQKAVVKNYFAKAADLLQKMN